MDNNELQEILRLHKMCLGTKEKDGKKVNPSGASLENADIEGAIGLAE